MLVIFTVLCFTCIGLSIISPGFKHTVKTSVNAVFVPIQKGINGMGLWFSNKNENMKEKKELQAENEKLKNQLDELTEENSLLAQNKYELERLRKLYNLDKTYSEYPKVAAHVVAKDDSGNWFSSFTIDKGTDAGLTVDMNVIADGGLAGIVTEVGRNYAKVKAIIDDGYNVSGKTASASDLCIVEGDRTLLEKGLLRLSNILTDSVVKEGDMIQTSHISNKYLPGILMGYVSKVADDASGLTKSGYLMPAVDFGHLEEVFVITRLKEDYSK